MDTYGGKAVCRHSKKAVVYESGRDLSPGTEFSSTLTIDFYFLELPEIKCLLVKPAHTWDFVTVAWSGSYGTASLSGGSFIAVI